MIIAKYIITRFLKTFIFAIFALCLIFVIVDLLEHLDDFMDKSASIQVIAGYYLVYLPKIIEIMTPVACLLAILFTIGMMSTRNEITALKSAGFSLYKIMIPCVLLGIAISGFMIYFNGWVVPISYTKQIMIESEYIKKNKTGGPIYDLYFRDSPVKNFSVEYYNSDKFFGAKPAIDSFTSGASPRLLKRIEANTIVWDTTDNQWLLVNAVTRDYQNKLITSKQTDTLVANLSLTHHELIKMNKKISEMNYNEVKNYLVLLKNGGKDIRKQMIEYYGNYAFCFSSLIVMLFGVPFASVKRKSGIAMQIGAALVISFIYLLFTKFSQTIGYSQNWDPILTGWMANMLFLFFGLIVIFKTRT